MKKNKLFIPMACALTCCSGIPLVMMASCTTSGTITADGLLISEDGTLYGLDLSKVDVSRCNELIMPDYVYGIADTAFAGVFATSKNSHVTKIVFSPKINFIGAAAFAGCDSITTFDFSKMKHTDLESMIVNSRQQAFVGLPENLTGDILFPTDGDSIEIKTYALHKLCVEGGLPGFWLKPEASVTRTQRTIIIGCAQEYPYDPIYTPLSEKDSEWLVDYNFADEYLNTYVRRVPGIFIDDLIWTYSESAWREVIWPEKTISMFWMDAYNAKVGDEEKIPTDPMFSRYNLSFDLRFTMEFTDGGLLDYTVNYKNMQICCGGPGGWYIPTLSFNYLFEDGKKMGSWSIVIKNNRTGAIDWNIDQPTKVMQFYREDRNLYNFLLDDGQEELGRSGFYIRPHFLINRHIPH